MRVKTTAFIICLAFMATIFYAAPAAAIDYSPLSTSHGDYGYSQYQAGSASGSGCKPKILNPTPVPMIAIAFLYVRNSGVGESEGAFSHCAAAEVGPHAVVTVDGLCPGVVEVIAVPKQPVMVNGQRSFVADGLGVQVHLGSYGGGELSHMFPPLFSGPTDPLDRKAAAACVTAELKNIGVNPGIFSDFADIY